MRNSTFTKPRQPLKRSSKAINKSGRKGKASAKASRVNNQFFIKENISFCERCGSGLWLSKAHRFKRRFITSESEMLITVLLCQCCHDFVDLKLTHSEMRDELTRIIESRETRFTEPA